MTSINGVSSSYAEMTELLKAQAEQMAKLMQIATQGNIDMARKLAGMSAEAGVEAAKQDVVGQVLDMYV